MAPIKSWIYEFSKEQLVAVAASYGMDTSGRLDEIRARMSLYVDSHPEKFAIAPIPPSANRSRTPVNGVDPPPALSIPTATSPYLPLLPAAMLVADESRDNYAKILNQIRKWGCHFDERDPVAFLERVEELREGYRYSEAQLLAGLPELLRGDALLWHRNNREDWETWEDFSRDFRMQYFPPRYTERLKREILERRQGSAERFN